MECRFDTVFVVGCGKIAVDILHYIADMQSDYGYKVTFLEYENNQLLNIKDMCRSLSAEYIKMPDKIDLTDFLSSIRNSALIISAGNYYIFPKSVVQKNNLEIINFHNALLPKLPGRNAPTWAIFLKEKVSGATWHYVTEEIDHGEIIIQLQTAITDDMKAYELTKIIMELAYEGFQDVFPTLLEKHVSGVEIKEDVGKRKIYYSYEIPENGICTKDMPVERVYRLLRAVDYGKAQIFPPVRMIIDQDDEVEIVRYSKKEIENCSAEIQFVRDEKESCIYILLDNAHELKLKYRKILGDRSSGRKDFEHSGKSE